ncbi:lipase family protein [Streptomyces sp. NBC_00873]|uniref:alpha/beta hydrolase family protein n=1 Tax=Streptomyces sp. NBC_00873 TaxID=2975852 RepID=UPI00386FD8A2|nr:lipase family protein [Streptomyces sp. NBC_00873]
MISATPVVDMDAKEVTARLEKTGIQAAQVRYGVRAHRVVYRTVDMKGRPTTASELVAIPKNGEPGLRVVSWLHGTEVYRGEVASVNDESTDRATALLFASTGLAVSAPDYLGLGEGPGSHPYGDPEATVTASVDALRAARTFAQRNGRSLDRRVLISGFSQGGPATMMVGRALQQGTDRYFRLGALAPIAGPFDLSGFEAAAADDKIARSSLYLAYFATAWNRMYGLYDTPGQAFRAPFDKTVETLFDGDHKASEIAAALPMTSKELFTDEFLQRVRNPTGKLRHRLQALDTTCDWRPEVPVHLFHAKGDKDVSVTNSQYCQRQLTANEADQELSDVGDFDHGTTVLKAVPQVVREFNTAR